ncbi:MAG: YtxH domain-containing protein [Bryobacteraceae bacterium]|nr:YtxH domain-containing protein [Bryobacteraceae bacterium]
MSTKTGWMMLGAGALAGAAAALLYAPQSGYHSRRDLRRKSQRLYRRIEDKSAKAYDSTRSAVNGACKRSMNYLSGVAAPAGVWAWRRLGR